MLLLVCLFLSQLWVQSSLQTLKFLREKWQECSVDECSVDQTKLDFLNRILDESRILRRLLLDENLKYTQEILYSVLLPLFLVLQKRLILSRQLMPSLKLTIKISQIAPIFLEFMDMLVSLQHSLRRYSHQLYRVFLRIFQYFLYKQIPHTSFHIPQLNLKAYTFARHHSEFECFWNDQDTLLMMGQLI